MRKITAIVLVCVLSMLLSGCHVINLDVENQLIPPQNDKEQNAMQATLDAYLEDEPYTLTYPSGGQYQTPFIVLSQIQKQQVLSEETDRAPRSADPLNLNEWGIAFYRKDNSGEKTHIHLFKKLENGTWHSAADVEGLSDGVADVNFGDINGDDFPELLVGWNLYNTHDKRLAIYYLSESLALLPFEHAYTSLLTAELTDDDKEDVLLFAIDRGQAGVKAHLFSCEEREMVLRGTTALDRHILSFGRSFVAALSPTVNGVFIDAYKDTDTTITELLYWDGTTLESPFSDNATDLNTVTARENGLECRDIDGDGVVEWPVSERLPQYEGVNIQETLWRTDWMSYNFRTATIERKFSSIVNLMDGYMLRLRDEWLEDTVAITYNTQDKTLVLQEEEPFLELLTTSVDTKAELPEGYSYFDGLNTWKYAVRTNDETISLEEVQYLFVIL